MTWVAVEYHSLKDLLRERVLNIHFYKKDGTERHMKCTLLPSIIEDKFSTALMSESKPKQIRSLAVYDVEKDAWRSIIIENIISYNIAE